MGFEVPYTWIQMFLDEIQYYGVALWLWNTEESQDLSFLYSPGTNDLPIFLPRELIINQNCGYTNITQLNHLN